MAKIVTWRGKNNSLKMRDDNAFNENQISFVHIYTVLAKDGISWTYEIRLRRAYRNGSRIKGIEKFTERILAQIAGEHQYKKMAKHYQVGIYKLE